MKADRLTIGQLFDTTRRLVAPLYQRSYVWKRKSNWEPLWNSVIEIAEQRLAGQQARPHFVGAIVLDQLPTRTGMVETREIIDGQQRLTTIQIAIAALRNYCGSVGAARYADAWKRLSVNDVPLSDDVNEEFKVWPTNVDRTSFAAVMRNGAAHQPQEQGSEGHDLIAEAYSYYHNRASRWIGPAESDALDQRLSSLYRALRDDVQLVVIDLEQHDDAQVIFQTLNALGTPLLPADLIKNHLLHLVEARGGQTEALYVQHWEPIDRAAAYWRAEILQGRLSRPRIDAFLQHYLTLVTRKEVSAVHLYAEFRDFAAARRDLTPDDHLKLIHNHAEVYKRFDAHPRGSREHEFFYRLEQLDTTTVHPLLLDVFSRIPLCQD